MFSFTNEIRVSNANGLNVSFRGFTIARFKARHVDPLEGGRDLPQSRFTRNTRTMNTDLMDLSQPVVQHALAKSFIYARNAAQDAASYFAKRPGGIHRYADMAKIFRRHFNLDAPSTAQRDEVERVFKAISAGLNAPVVISDLLAAKDGTGDRGLVDGAEGQVVFSPEEDIVYMRDLMLPENAERSVDVTREHLAASRDPDIFIAFANLKFWNIAQMARVIIHEASHKFAYTGDYAYHTEANKYANMPPAKAIQNADSYAYGAVSVKESSALTPEKIQRVASALIPLSELQRIIPSLH